MSETIWSHFWLLQGRDVKTLGNLLGVFLGCFDRFFPRPWALGSRLGTTQQPDSDCPRKHKHTHNAVRPCICHATANSSAREYIRVLTRLLCHSLRRRYPKCSVRLECASLCLLSLTFSCPALPSSSPSCPTPCRLSDAGEIVPSVTFLVTWTCCQTSLVHRCYFVPSTKPFLSTSTISSRRAGPWRSCDTPPARVSYPS